MWVVWLCVFCCFFFFFKQKTAYEMRISDWSSDVCSSDLEALMRAGGVYARLMAEQARQSAVSVAVDAAPVSGTAETVADLPGGAARPVTEGIIKEIGRASRRERVCQYV